jgi:DNA-binding MarR family transcriptional regulator
MATFRVSDCTNERAPGRLIRRIDKMMRDIIDERLAPLGLSYPQWASIKLTVEGTVGTAGELARELDYSTGATTRLIDGLEALGYLARERDGEDRRVVRIVVTPQGSDVADRGKLVAISAWNEMLENIGQDEANLLVDTLVKLKANVEARYSRRGTLSEAAE